MRHSAGCIDFDPDDYSWFMLHKYYLAVIALITGPLVAIGGKRFFPYIAAVVISVFMFLVAMIFLAVLGTVNTTVGLILSLIGALALSVITGYFIKTCYRCLVVTFGGIFGIVLGIAFYSALAVGFHFSSAIVLVVICSFFAFISGGYAFYYGDHIVVFGTAIVGSYIFMRGIAAFYGGFPDFSDITDWFKGDSDLNSPGLFWLSVSLFVVFSLLASWWQYYRMEYHKSLLQNEDFFMRVKDEEDGEAKKA